MSIILSNNNEDANLLLPKDMEEIKNNVDAIDYIKPLDVGPILIMPNLDKIRY